MKVLNRQDFAAGLLFIMIGGGALTIASSYGVGGASRIGPGLFPMLLGGLLVALGMILAVRAIQRPSGEIGRVSWRPFLFVCLAGILFALLVERAGFATAAIALIITGRLAQHDHGWVETGMLAVALTAAAAGVFLFGLGLPIPLWPDFSR